VVSRSAETKLPAKFLAVSVSPFSMPSPSNAASKADDRLQVTDDSQADSQTAICHL
jgi:hypothetical protein